MSEVGKIQWTPYAKIKLAVLTALADVQKSEKALTEEMMQAVSAWLNDKAADMATDARKFYEEAYLSDSEDPEGL